MKHLQVKAFLTKYISVSGEEFNDILSIVQLTHHDKNDFLQKRGEICETLRFIVSGAVRSFYIDKNEVEHSVDFLFENEPLLDIDSFFKQIPASYNAATIEPSVLINVRHNQFLDFLEKHPRFETVVRKVIADYMTLGGERSNLLRIPSAMDRYKMFVKKRGKLLNRVPLKYIASYLDMATETLSRVRAGKP